MNELSTEDFCELGAVKTSCFEVLVQTKRQPDFFHSLLSQELAILPAVKICERYYTSVSINVTTRLHSTQFAVTYRFLLVKAVWLHPLVATTTTCIASFLPNKHIYMCRSLTYKTMQHVNSTCWHAHWHPSLSLVNMKLSLCVEYNVYLVVFSVYMFVGDSGERLSKGRFFDRGGIWTL